MNHASVSRAVALLRGREGYSWLGLLVSFALVSLIVVTGSRAAFTDSTDSTDSVFAAGDVVLTDDDLGGILFNVSNMAPGDEAVNCIAVTYSGSITDPGPVRLYSGGFSDATGLAGHLNVTIEEGSGGVFGDCSSFASQGTVFSGTLAAFDTDHSNYANGAGTWDPSSTPESKSYRITVELDSGTPNSQQGAAVTDVGFVWEVST
jgi:predicted ribosomally synthesized peptide with SipW-like signal peptide